MVAKMMAEKNKNKKKAFCCSLKQSYTHVLLITLLPLTFTPWRVNKGRCFLKEREFTRGRDEQCIINCKFLNTLHACMISED